MVTDPFTQKLWARHCELCNQAKALRLDLTKKLSEAASSSMQQMFSHFGSGQHITLQDALAPFEAHRAEMVPLEDQLAGVLKEADMVSRLFWSSVRYDLPEEDKAGSLGAYDGWKLVLTPKKEEPDDELGGDDCPFGPGLAEMLASGGPFGLGPGVLLRVLRRRP